MNKKTVDLNTFAVDPAAFGRYELLLAVKSFDLQAIRKRYLASRSRSKTGSVERREPAVGGIVHAVIENGEIVRQDIIAELVEPRGVDLNGNTIAISSENRIFIFRPGANEPIEVNHPWLSYIHTVRFNETGDRILVSSSGVDTLLEFDLDSGQASWEWVAWEHGLNTGENPADSSKHYLTRNPGEARRLEAEGKNVILITEPREQTLPTALRAAFMNSAEYDQSGDVLATLFHHGQVLRIDKTKGNWQPVISGMSKPHGGMQRDTAFVATDTGGGRVVFAEPETETSYDFSELPGKDPSLGELEWLLYRFTRRDN
jgi:hypothetical protein